MAKVHSASLVVLILILSAGSVAAQPSAPSLDLKPALELQASSRLPQQPARRDSLWNGILIGAAVGVGSAVALDAVFCDVPDGRCDTPWAAYFTLGGIGAAAGAGIDFVIGRNKPNEAKTTIRLAPGVGNTSKGVRASIRF